MSASAIPTEFDAGVSDETLLAAWAAEKDSRPGSDTNEPGGDMTDAVPPARPDPAAAAADPVDEPEDTDDDEPETGADDDDDDDDGEPDETDEDAGDPAAGELDEWAADLDPAIQDKIRAKNAAARERIDKLKSQREAARSARDAAAAERDAIRERANAVLRQPIPLARTEQEPLSHVTSTELLQREIAEAEAAVQWAIDHADGAEITDDKGRSSSYDAAAVARIKARAESVLHRHAPAREKYLEAHAAASAEARRLYPRLYQDGTPEKSFALKVMNAVPELARMPDYEVLLGKLAHGHVTALDESKGVKWVRVKPRSDAPAAPNPEAGGKKPKPQSAPPASLAGSTRPAALAPGQKPEPGAVLRQRLKDATDSDSLERAVMQSLEARFARSA